MLTIRADQAHSMSRTSGAPRMIVPCQETETWIGIEVVDAEGRPAEGVRYRIQLPDTATVESTVDKDGKARFDHLTGGNCVITFPDLDVEAWEPL